MVWKLQNKKELSLKGTVVATLGPVLVVACAMSILKAEPVSRLFGFIEFFGVIFFVVAFLWHEIGRTYPDEQVKKRRIYAIASALSGLALAPLMLILLTWQFVSTYKLYSSLSPSRTFVEKFNDERTACYIISIVSIWVATAFAVYSTILNH